jgi:hypothetical protein
MMGERCYFRRSWSDLGRIFQRRYLRPLSRKSIYHTKSRNKISASRLQRLEEASTGMLIRLSAVRQGCIWSAKSGPNITPSPGPDGNSHHLFVQSQVRTAKRICSRLRRQAKAEIPALCSNFHSLLPQVQHSIHITRTFTTGPTIAKRYTVASVLTC